jgi:nitrogen fixation protein FixH
MQTKFNPWPYGIIAFFGLLFCGIATALAIALTHRETMVNDNYYERELNFQQQIDSAVRAQKSGARIQLVAGKLLVTVPAEQVTKTLSGAIRFYRPSSAEMDRECPFAPDASGSQTLDISKFAAGLWRVQFTWSAGGQDYFLEQKLTL